jgi:hypothetical protein
MRRDWTIAVACVAYFAAPLAHGQQRDLHRGEPAPVVSHRTMSPIGRAMADLLRQATPAHAPAVTSTLAPERTQPPATVAQSATSQSQSPVVRSDGEVAVQPPR